VPGDFSTDHAGTPPDPCGDLLALQALDDPSGDLLPVGVGQHPALAAHSVLLIGDVADVYTKINFFDRLGSR
jgi:hypothetical protein